MKDKFVKYTVIATIILAGGLILGSVGAYESDDISGVQFFWQITVAILLIISSMIAYFCKLVLEDNTELREELNAIIIEEAEEVIIPKEEFKFTIPEGGDYDRTRKNI